MAETNKPESQNKLNTAAILILVLTVAFMFRFYGLGHESLWNDELSSMHRSSYDTLTMVLDLGVVPDVHPPGYQVLLFFIVKVFGATETTLRFPSALAGVVTVLLIYSFGKTLFNSRTALFAAGMLAVSPMHIWLSQEARPYSILIMLTVMIADLILRYTSCKNRRRRKAILALIALNVILLSYLHYFGLLVSALAGIALLAYSIRRKQDRIAIAISLAIPVVAYLPWIPVMISQSANGSYIANPDMMSLVYLFIEYMGWSKPLLLVFVVLLTLPVLMLLRKKFTYSSEVLTLVYWIAAPIIVSFVVSLLLNPIFTNRNMMIALPAVILLQAFCISEGIPNARIGNAIWVLLVFLMIGQLICVRKHYTEPHRNQFREVAYYVAEQVDESENTVILSSAWNTEYFDYYFRRAGTWLHTDMQAISVEDFHAVKDLLSSKNASEVWFLWGHVVPDSALIDSLDEMFRQAEYTPFLGAGVWRYFEPI